MKMKKFTILFLATLLIAIITCCTGNMLKAVAQEIPATDIVQETPTPENEDESLPAEEEGPPAEDVDGENTVPPQDSDHSSIDEDVKETQSDIVISFIQYLKDEYGAEYETYYNAIIEQWGSVKNYLNAQIEDGTLTDETADAWSLVVNWLDEYFVIWAPILATIALVIAFIAGRKVYSAIKNLFIRLFKGTNQTATAQIAIIDAMLLMLGKGEKTKKQREELEEAKKELLKNE